MTNTEKLLIQLLSAFVNDKTAQNITEYNVDKLYTLAQAQAVAGIAGYELIRSGFENKSNGDERLSLAFDRTVTQFVRRDVYAKQLLSTLNTSEIPHIIFKGLVIKECYPVPELRTYSDVDIIIRQEDREKTHKLMLSLGFESAVMDGGDVYSYKKGREYYEIHTTLNSERTKLSEYMRGYWKYTKVRNGFTYEFDTDFHFCYLISHIEKHVYGSGAGVRMYLDIALFLKKYKNQLDMNKVREILRECKLEKFLDTVLFLCNKWFDTDVKPQEELSEELYEKFCQITLSGGTFGHKTVSDKAETEVRRSLKGSGKISKIKVILSHIFPPYREVKRLYPAFDKKPYLLPVAWCVHFVKAAKRSGLKNVKLIASADVNAAKSEKEILEQIGSKR